MTQPFSVFDYQDYRSLLRARTRSRKSCTQRAIAKRLKCSNGYVSMIVNGKRNLSLGDARRWSRALFLGPEEATYFEALVQAEHAPTIELARAARVQAEATQRYHRAKSSRMDGVVQGGWPRIVLLELAKCEGFQPDPAWVAARVPGLDVNQARAELERLRAAGTIAAEPDHATPIEVEDDDLAKDVAQLHHDLIARADASLGEPPQHRHFGANCLAVRREDIPTLKHALHRLLVETIEPLRGHPDADRVVALGVFLVPMSGEIDTGPRP